MNKDRLAAFSDGVIAILITIMVLDLKVPHSSDWSALIEVLPVVLSYTLSFVYLAIYWNNHHHLLHAATRVNGAVLWANNNLLFWLSLVPFATAWAGENHFTRNPTILYGVALLMPALAYRALVSALQRMEGSDALFSRAVGSDLKGKISPVLYFLGLLSAFFEPLVAYLFYVSVALIWLVPDQRIERRLVEAAARREPE